jgi:hypothetical protein
MKWKPKIGKDSPNWKGGKTKNTVTGYILVYVGTGKHGTYVAEHILVMEKYLGRKLTKDEIVHHKDESFEGRSNNDISNLQLVTRSWHQKHHNKTKGYCVSFNKGTKNQWRLRIRNKADTGWLSAGLYETEELALQAVKKYKIYHSKENKGVGK